MQKALHWLDENLEEFILVIGLIAMTVIMGIQVFAEKFAEETYRLNNGQMKIQFYPNSTLGGDRDLLETCADGDIPFIVQNTAPQVSFMSDLAVFDLPCVFDFLESCREKIDDPKFQTPISNIYTNGGYHLLGMADQGFRVMSTNKPVQSIDDFFKDLPKKDQEIMTQAAKIATAYAREQSDKRISDKIRTIEESGTEISASYMHAE